MYQMCADLQISYIFFYVYRVCKWKICIAYTLCLTCISCLQGCVLCVLHTHPASLFGHVPIQAWVTFFVPLLLLPQLVAGVAGSWQLVAGGCQLPSCLQLAALLAQLLGAWCQAASLDRCCRSLEACRFCTRRQHTNSIKKSFTLMHTK